MDIVMNLQVHTLMKFLLLVVIINCPENESVLCGKFGCQMKTCSILILLHFPMDIWLISWQWPLLFSSSYLPFFLLLHASFWYWAICQHPSALCLIICSSALQQAFFLQDFILQCVFGFWCQTSLLHAQPTYNLQCTCVTWYHISVFR